MRLLPASLCLSLAAVGATPASAQAQAAPPGEGPTIIFFAWDRPAIDGDAAASLDTVAAALSGQPGARIELGGHADRSGPAAANIRSGRVRAEAVADYLAARGVPRSAMTLVSHGEERPLIPTADGVREPHNRRVEIIVRRAPGS